MRHANTVEMREFYRATEAWFVDLAEPYLRHLTEEHNAIVEAHKIITTAPRFSYRGKLYAAEGVSPYKGTLVPLVSNLHARFEELLMQKARHIQEWAPTKQLLQHVMGKAQDYQELRDMFPDSLARTFPLECVKALPRTRPDFYAGYKDDPDYARNREERELFWDAPTLEMAEQFMPTINLYLSYLIL